MKTKYLFVLVTIILLFLKTSPNYAGDTTYVYTYDASGNRTERVIDLTKSAQIVNNLSSEKDEEITEELTNFNLKIYPNPTKGILKIELIGNKEEKVRIIVYNSNGIQILNKRIPNKGSTLNLSKYAAGMYILKVLAGQNTTEWKILKE